MFNFKWCVFDLDGTLLNEEKNISDEDLKSIKRLMKEDVEIFIASGRTDMFSLPHLELIGSKTPIISSNGALVRNPLDNIIIYSKFINHTSVNKFIEYVKADDLNYLAYTLDSVYYHVTNDNVLKELFRNNKAEINFINVYDPDILKNDEILKFLIVDEHENIPKRQKELVLMLDLYVVSSGYYLLDLMEKGVSKGYALKKLADYYKMDPEKIIVFGDNYNDMDMFTFAGTSVAMGNAVDKIKALADFVTKSNEENGISYAIENFILNNVFWVEES